MLPQLSIQLVQGFVDSDEKFVLDLDLLVDWVGYSTKQKAKNKLFNNFDCDTDYTITQMVKRVEGNNGGGSVRYESIKLTIDCFKSMCMMAGTPKGKEVRAYFLECEKTAKSSVKVISEQDKHIKALELELKIREIDSTMLSLHGRETVLALRGKSDQMIETDRPTIEIIDGGVKYVGQSLAQIKDYALKKFGIRFKSGTDIKRFLESCGAEGLIGQTPRKVLTDYVPTENLEEVYKILRNNGNHQLLLGE